MNDFLEIHSQTFAELLSNRELPEFLYHYTSFEALTKILDGNNSSILATDTRFLNDVAEIQHALKLYDEEKSKRIEKITQYLNGYGYKIYQGDFSNKIKKVEHLALFKVVATLNRSKNHDSFNHQVLTVSFSEVEDLLSQWRSYCSQGGVSIGFESVHLQKVANELPNNHNAHSQAAIFPCIYDENLQRQIINEIIDFYENELKLYMSTNLGDIVTEDMWGTGATYMPNVQTYSEYYSPKIFKEIIRVAPLFKNKAFEEEREWRLVIDGRNILPEQFIFRPKNEMLAPSFSVPLVKAEMEQSRLSVCIGPNEEFRQEIAKTGVELFLKTKGFKNLILKKSSAPFRNYR